MNKSSRTAIPSAYKNLFYTYDEGEFQSITSQHRQLSDSSQPSFWRNSTKIERSIKIFKVGDFFRGEIIDFRDDALRQRFLTISRE
jgi:hypothetical protein